MSSSLPPEIFDLIVDHLCDERAVLSACCTVSKSWVPRARKNLFFCVRFESEACVQSWMKTFPDPSSSPAHHTRVLVLRWYEATTAASTHARPWVRSFCHIVELQVITYRRVSYLPFLGLSPILKSLSLNHSFISAKEVLNLICTFPLLENLRLHSHSDGIDTVTDGWDAPSHSPKLTGTLHLSGRIRSVASLLLRLPNGLRSSKIAITCSVQDAGSIHDLIFKCSDTLQSLCIGYHSSCAFFLQPRWWRRTLPSIIARNTFPVPPPTDLSNLTRLKNVEFQIYGPNTQWITDSLQTAKSKNLRQITIYPIPASGEPVHQEWLDLDSLLAQLWTSRSVLPKIVFPERFGMGGLAHLAPTLFPKLTSRGVEPVMCHASFEGECDAGTTIELDSRTIGMRVCSYCLVFSEDSSF